MKQIFLLYLPLLIFICPGTLNAQSTYDPQISIAKIKTGKTLHDNSGISAIEITFPGYPSNVHYDNARNHLQVVLRERNGKYFKMKGAIITIEPENGVVHWSKDVTDRRFNFETTKDYFTYTQPEEVAVYDRTNYTLKWERHFNTAYIDTLHNIIYAHDGTAFDLQTGRKKWKIFIDDKFGWVEYNNFNDSIVLISNVGLKGVHVKTGKMWHHQTVADARVFPLGSSSSNIFVDSGLVYFASKDIIACIAPSGRAIWKVALPKKQTYNTILWRNRNTIVLLNMSSAYISGKLYDAGVPYLAAFDKRTGKQIYLSTPGSKKTVIHALALNDTLLLHTQDKLYSYNIAKGEKIAEADAPDNGLSNNVKFLSSQRYFTKSQDGQYASLNELYPGEYFLAGKDNTVRLDRQLKPAGSFTDAVWELHGTYSDIEILKHDNAYAFIRNGKIVGEYSATNAAIHNNWLIDQRETSLRIIDLRTL